MHLDHAFLGGEAKWLSRWAEASEKAIRGGRKLVDAAGVKATAKRAARMVLRNGTTAVRTHVNVDKLYGLREMKALVELKKESADWIDLQLVAFSSGDALTTSKESEAFLREAMKLGADAVGGLPNMDSDPAGYMDIVFDVAKRHRALVDLHVDETNDPNSRALEILADKTMEYGYEGKVSASHCCALSSYSEEDARRVISKVREAEMSIISNPFTNLYLVSGGRKPNGMTRVRELLDAGVNTVYGTDNMNDGYNSLGNGDMLLAALFVAYLNDLGGMRAFRTILDMGTVAPAKATGMIPNYGIKEGGRADLVIFDEKTPWDAVIFQARRSFVIKNGKIVVEDGKLLI